MKKTRTEYDIPGIHAAARGRWPEILSSIGKLPWDFIHFDRKEGPCPKCGGDTRFRGIDEEKGALFCSHCFSKNNGDGIAALCWLTGLDFPDVAAQLSDHLNVPPIAKPTPSSNGRAGPKKNATPTDHLAWKPWADLPVLLWLTSKPGMTLEGVKAAGAKLARYEFWSEETGNYETNVVVIPIYSTTPIPGTEPDPCGYVAWNLSRDHGGKLPASGGKGKKVSWLKMKTMAGSKTGLMFAHGLQRLATTHTPRPELVWKTAGPSDAIALFSIIPPELRETHIVITNSAGENENVKSAWAALFTGLKVVPIHDADETGKIGALKWVKALLPVAAEVRNPQLPFSDATTPGKKDIRDFVAGGGTYQELLALVDATTVADKSAVSIIENLSNAKTIETADGEEKKVPMHLREVVLSVLEKTGNWPRRIDKTLFVHDSELGICWLDTVPALFGWLQSKCGILEWHRGIGYPTKDEVFAEFCRTATCYRAIEYLPHWPAIPDHYYACTVPEPGDGEILGQLLDRFSPETEIDRLLILAMFVTPFWGGKGGQRPMFILTSEAGRGVGKSKLVDFVCNLAGGPFEVTPQEDTKSIRERLLSPDGMDKRAVRIDNLKSHKLSWADLESLITAPIISGRRMYVGEGSRPNTLTWMLTLNGISLSTDMAQRAIVVRLKRPTQSESWEDTTARFIDDNRQQIIADILGFLQIEDTVKLSNYSRWAPWENAIICHMDQAEKVQETIKRRAGAADTELEESEEIERHFRWKLESIYLGIETARIHIPTGIAASWYRDFTNDRNKSTIVCSKILSQFCEEGRFHEISINPSKKYGRGFVFGKKENAKTVSYDLQDQIEAKEIEDAEKKYETRRASWKSNGGDNGQF